MKKCSNCGNQVDDNVVICTNCGNTNLSFENTNDLQNNTSKTTDKKESNKVEYWIIAFFCYITFSSLFVFFNENSYIYIIISILSFIICYLFCKRKKIARILGMIFGTLVFMLGIFIILFGIYMIICFFNIINLFIFGSIMMIFTLPPLLLGSRIYDYFEKNKDKYSN